MSNRSKLLIVDDEPELLDVTSFCLMELPIDIIKASSAVEALKIIKDDNISFDAILSDYKMPKMNGLELLFEIRTAGISTPFIILTGFGEKESAVKALRLGAYDFLDKPCETSDLIKVVSHAIEVGVMLRSVEAEINLLYEKNGNQGYANYWGKELHARILLIKREHERLKRKRA